MRLMRCPGELFWLQVGSREREEPLAARWLLVFLCARLINANEIAPLQLEVCSVLCLDVVCCHANVLDDFASSRYLSSSLQLALPSSSCVFFSL